MNFTAIDFETANRRRASACSIGLAKVRDGVVVDTYYELIRPEPDEFEYINVATHGITREMVSSSPTMAEAWETITTFIKDDVLVAHNCCFEQSVINQYMTLKGLPIPDFDYLCTLYMTKVNYPLRLRYKLDQVNHHHALEDALACAELAVHLMGGFRTQEPRELIGALYVTPQRQKPDWVKLTGIKPSKEELDCNHPFYEQNFVLTGELASMSRERAVQHLVDCGGLYQNGITKATNYLLVGDQEHQTALFGGPSVKMRKALEYQAKGLNIQILTEEGFRRVVVP